MSEHEPTPEIADGTRELHIRLDELMAPIYFQELLEVAEDVCLTHTPNYPGEFEVIGEAAIISQLGTRAIKAAIELEEGSVGVDSNDPNLQHDFETEYDRPIMLDTPLRLTERFSSGVDFSILAKAEAFGAELMAESFRVLGQDAYIKVEEFKQATTKKEQVAVINWLDRRLYALAYNKTHLDTVKEENDETDKFFYHPVRLSPKLMGVYPDNDLKPTCLSVSIIAAGFFKKAGADILHADVSRRNIEEEHALTFTFIHKMRERLEEKFGITLPETVKDSFHNLIRQHTDAFTYEEAHHAAVYVRLIDDTWAQFDSNYMSSLPITNEHANDILTNNYNQLTSMSPVAPGIEMLTHLPDSFAPAQIMQEIFERQDSSEVTSLILNTYLAFQNDDPESFSQRIFDTCIEPFFTVSSEDERLTLMNKLFKTEILFINGVAEETFIQNSFHKMFEKYVLWGESPEMVIARMKKDSNYLKDRVMDVAALPFIMMASAASTAAKDDGFYRPHATVELGLPEQRIGLAVLSDFATYTESPLTPSFWMSHWPGGVSVMENLQGSSHSSFEDSQIYNNVIHKQQHPLTSKRNYRIIRTFIDSRRPRKKENEDGTGTE